MPCISGARSCFLPESRAPCPPFSGWNNPLCKFLCSTVTSTITFQPSTFTFRTFVWNRGTWNLLPTTPSSCLPYISQSQSIPVPQFTDTTMSETEEESDYEEEEVEEEEDEERPSSPHDPYLRGYCDGFLNASSRFNSDEEEEEETDYEEEDVEEDEDEDYEERTSHSWKMSTRCKRFCAIFF